MTDLEKRAEAVVAEMVDLGATFTIAENGELWVWEARPPIMRIAIRRYWDGVEDRVVPGFNKAMVRAIRRRGGSHAQ